MKATKKLFTIIGLGIILATSSTTYAQGHKKEHEGKENLTVEQKAQKRTDKMTKQLKLTDKQATEAYDIHLKHIKEMDKIHSEMKALKAKAKAQRESSKLEMDKILTTEQKAKAKELHEKKMEKRKEKHGNNHGNHEDHDH